MAILNDTALIQAVDEGRIGLDPFDRTRVQPSSIDVCLGASFQVFANHLIDAIDLRERPRDLTREVLIGDDEPFVIHPGEFCLGTTVERVRVPEDLVCYVDGKSSLGRLGLIVHATAGVIDPGFDGTITLELSNLTRVPIKLYADLPIAQLSFSELTGPAARPYGHPELGSHYQGQLGATTSRYDPHA